MNATRYHELLGRVLDEELPPGEAEELTAWLRANPQTRSDLQRHLYLWELFAQQRLAERNADAFVAACQTRIQAEGDARSFIERTERRLQAVSEDKPSRKAGSFFADFIRRLVPRPAWVVAFAALALIVGLSIWILAPDSAVPILAMVSPNAVAVDRGGQPINATNGMNLQSGDVLRTAEDVNGTIGFAPENTIITIQPNTEFSLKNLSRGKHFALRTGKIEASVARQRPFRPMVIVTPQAEARVLGTRFTLAADTKATRLEVAQGKVRLTRAGDGSAVKVTAGNSASAATVPATGSIVYEYWTNVTGLWDPTWDSKLEEHPDGVEYPARFEAAGKSGDNFGERIRGYLYPPKTGDYTFWIAGDGFARFSLSRDDQPRNKVWIATAAETKKKPREWTSQRNQQSSVITLTAGRKYYIEVIQNDAGKGEHHLAVAWQGPDREREVIPGEFLSPFVTKAKEKKR